MQNLNSVSLINNPVARAGINWTRSRRKIEMIFFSLLAPAGLILFWKIAGDTGWSNTSIMPSPATIFDTFTDMLFSGNLARNLSITMLRVIEGFIIGAAAGVLIGAFMGIFPWVNRSVSVLFGILMPIPMIGWVPMVILWCGIGELSKIFVIALGTFWSVLLNTHDGIKNVDKKLVEVAEILEKGKFSILVKVVLPASLPSIITGIRLGIGNAWKSVVAAEMLAASRGIGYLIAFAREMSRPEVMIVGLLSIGFVGVLIDRVTLAAQKWALRWNAGAV
jgi:sulfonate transport system permease protein